MPRKKTYGETVKGELITEEFIEKAVKRAEEGWEIEELLTWKQVDQNPPPAPDARAQSARPRRPRRRP
jgi:hypothetical protein